MNLTDHQSGQRRGNVGRGMVRPCGGWLTLCVLFLACDSPTLAQDGATAPPADWSTWRVDREHPIYATEFDDPAHVADWRMEGGQSLSFENGNLVLVNDRRGDTESLPNGDHLVAWLRREIPADFLLEFTFRPELRTRGLNIVFFSARGQDGQSIFDPALQPRSGFFAQYHSGDINNYHLSYWAGDRKTANLRKNIGFHLVTEGQDLVTDAPADAFQTLRLYKLGGRIRFTVDDKLSVRWDDDGQMYGPVHTHAGWLGLRQMSYTGSSQYGRLAVYPLAGGE